MRYISSIRRGTPSILEGMPDTVLASVVLSEDQVRTTAKLAARAGHEWAVAHDWTTAQGPVSLLAIAQATREAADPNWDGPSGIQHPEVFFLYRQEPVVFHVTCTGNTQWEVDASGVALLARFDEENEWGRCPSWTGEVCPWDLEVPEGTPEGAVKWVEAVIS